MSDALPSNILASRAREAMQSGRYAEALVDLAILQRRMPDDPSIRLMLAYTHRASGGVEQAKTHFEAAIGLQPNELSFRGIYAQWLADIGEDEAAVAQFDAILDRHPGHLDARIDRLMSLARTSKREEALSELTKLVESKPEAIRAATNLAILLRDDDRLEEAEQVALKVLEREPGNARALQLVARCRYETGRDSLGAFAKAVSADPENLDLQSFYAHAHVEAGKTDEGVDLLTQVLADNPQWDDGYRLLADLKRQTTGSEGFASHYEQALEKDPLRHVLWTTYAALVARVEGHESSLEILKRAQKSAGKHELTGLAMANSLSELGRYDEAGERFAALDTKGNVENIKGYIRFLVKAQRFDEALSTSIDCIERFPDSGGEVWPYAAIAMRKLEDSRWEWLEGNEAFIQTFDIAERISDIDALADELRRLHVFRHQPITQSVRGGTQTGNILFRHESPLIQELAGHLKDCVASYIDNLPPPDPKHPLLGRPRNNFRFSGSWSVRLCDGGFHASHIHTHGDISSAFYVSLPPAIGQGETDSEKAGWLYLGEPAEELDTGLGPIREICPKPGTLALFPSTMWHGTRPFDAGERLTCAFDVRLNTF